MKSDHFREALEQIARYKYTPRAYRHQKFEDLIKIAEAALEEDGPPRVRSGG